VYLIKHKNKAKLKGLD